MDSLYRLTATEVLTKIKADEITVVDYASSLVARIDARDDAVQAWAYFNKKYVIEQARALDAVPKLERGPLHGVAIAVKDVIYTKGMVSQQCIILPLAQYYLRHAHLIQLTNIRR
jgi:Asp-tRNA(Asn)/Glu-tRNA(Gln) amidotransferase A subunit family amidase